MTSVHYYIKYKNFTFYFVVSYTSLCKVPVVWDFINNGLDMKFSDDYGRPETTLGGQTERDSLLPLLARTTVLR